MKISEVFRSLQGETRWSGLPAVFVRLSGCNLRCTWCDTQYAYEEGEPLGLASLLDRVGRLARPGDLVVVTGGEPLLQAGVHALLSALADSGRTVLLETNGSLDIAGVDARVHRILDVKCPGSGEHETTVWDNLALLRPEDEVKLVVRDRADFDYGVRVVTRHGLSERTGVVFSPVADALDPVELARWILDSGLPARLGLQLHRVIWPDQDRGV